MFQFAFSTHSAHQGQGFRCNGEPEIRKPGCKPSNTQDAQRIFEYDSVDSRFSEFLLLDLLPEVETK